MKQKIQESILIPEGVKCNYIENEFSCQKDSVVLTKKINVPGIIIKVKDNEILIEKEKANKNDLKVIYANRAHIKNLLNGLNEEYIYTLESCNVHFPMTLKLDGKKLLINNFLGEKVPRSAKILEGVKVDVKGSVITVSSHNKELAGHTAANIEKATRVGKRDRRIFQDGIFITKKPGDKE